MEAARVIYLLKAEKYKSLMDQAEGELIDRVVKDHTSITTSSRQKEAHRYLDGPGQHIAAYRRGKYQILTNGRSAFFLTSFLFDVEDTGYSSKDLSVFLRDPPGEAVDVSWMTLHMEIELRGGSDNRKKNLYVKLGRVCVNAKLLSQARAILGGEDLRVYQAGPLDMLQLESENGKAIVMPAIPEEYEADTLVDVTAGVAI